MEDGPGPARPSTVQSQEAPPLLSEAMGLDDDQIAELLGDGVSPIDPAPVVLAELRWSLADVDGVTLIGTSESGWVYLSVSDKQYWVIQASPSGVDDVELVRAATDSQALQDFVEGFVDGNNDPVIVFQRERDWMRDRNPAEQ